MSGDDLSGNFSGEPTFRLESLELRCVRAGNDNYTVELALGSGFVEQRKIYMEPSTVRRGIVRLQLPASANGRMQNPLKSPSMQVVRENQFTETSTVRPAGLIEIASSEGMLDGEPHIGITGEQNMNFTIGIEYLSRQMPGK